MLLMHADETNLDDSRDEVEFFIYGGVAVPAENVHELSQAVEAIRAEAGFEDADSLKFGSNTRPAHISRDAWTAAKSATLDAATAAGAELLAVLVHHSIANNDNRLDWQLSNLAWRFERLLRQRDEHGFMVIDRQSSGDEYKMLRERWQLGSTKPGGHRAKHDRIMGFAATCDGASHLASVTDIALGSLAYCVNERRPDRTAPQALMKHVSPLFYRPNENCDAFIAGIEFTPAHPQFYWADYQSLRRHLSSLGLG